MSAEKERTIESYIEDGHFTATSKVIRDGISQRTFLKEIEQYAIEHNVQTYCDYLYDTYIKPSLNGAKVSNLNKVDFQKEYNLTTTDINRLTKKYNFRFAVSGGKEIDEQQIQSFIKNGMFTMELTSLANYLMVDQISLKKYAEKNKIKLFDPKVLIKKYIKNGTYTLPTAKLASTIKLSKWYIYKYASDNNITFCGHHKINSDLLNKLTPYIDAERKCLTTSLQTIKDETQIADATLKECLKLKGCLSQQEYKAVLFKKYSKYVFGSGSRKIIALSKAEEQKASEELHVPLSEVQSDIAFYREHLIKEATKENARKHLDPYLEDDGYTLSKTLVAISQELGVSNIIVSRWANTLGYVSKHKRRRTSDISKIIREKCEDLLSQYIIDSTYKVTKIGWSIIASKHNVPYIDIYKSARKKGYMNLSDFLKFEGGKSPREFSISITRKVKQNIYSMPIYDACLLTSVLPFEMLMCYVITKQIPRSIYSMIFPNEKVFIIEPLCIANILGAKKSDIEKTLDSIGCVDAPTYVSRKNLDFDTLRKTVSDLLNSEQFKQQTYMKQVEELIKQCNIAPDIAKITFFYVKTYEKTERG